MKKIIVFIMFFCSFVCAMEQEAARERYGRCLSSATGKDVGCFGNNFPADTYYNVHLKSCMLTYMQGVALESFPMRKGKVVKNYTDCKAYCEDNLELYGPSSYKSCLQQCALVYQVNDQLKKIKK